jgi:hypothetical protein
LGGTKEDKSHGVIQTSDGGFMILGVTGSADGDVKTNPGQGIGWLVKLSATGSILWERCIGGSGGDLILYDGTGRIIETFDGGLAFCGPGISTDGDVGGTNGKEDAWIVKLNATGIIEWTKTYGGSQYDRLVSIIQTPDSGYILAGNNSSPDFDVTCNKGWYDGWVIKLDDTGKIEWQKCYGGTKADDIRCIASTRDGGYVFVGNTDSKDGDVKNNPDADNRIWTVKINSTGTIEWERTFGGSNLERGYTVVERSNNDIVMVGQSSSVDGDVVNNKGKENVVIVSYSKTGDFQWKKIMGGGGLDMAYRIINTPDNGMLVGGILGSSDGDGNGSGYHGITNAPRDCWLIKLSANTGIDDVIADEGINVYPTVTSGLVNVDLQGRDEKITMQLLNVLGQPVELEYDAEGMKRKVYLKDIPAGVYFLNISNRDFRSSYKIVYQP